MIQPEPLTTDEPLFWSPGRGTDVWEMFCAAKAGDLPRVTQLVTSDPSLARCNYEYHTPLAFAVRANRVEVAAFLLDRGATCFCNPMENARDRGYGEMERMLDTKLGGSPGSLAAGERMAAAIRERELSKVRALLDASPELVHAADEGTSRPIHWAAMTRQLDVIDELLARGADVNARRRDGARPIQLTNGDYSYRGWRDVPESVSTKPREVLDHLRARGAHCDICTAAHIGDVHRVRELLDEDPTLANRASDYVSYYACSGTPLRNAAAGGHMEIVTLLLERGADPNLPEEHIAPRGHALYAAVVNGHHAIARLLLERGAYPNVPVESSADTLSRALANRDREMVDLLASHGAARSLSLLAYGGDVVTAAAIFAANPALADDPEALAFAAENGHEPFVRLLLRYQPQLARRVATGGRTREITELLFRHGMDPNRQDWLHKTPLHCLAERDDVENAEIFVERGADLHARDEEFSSTPLGFAARRGRVRMVEFLLGRGARAPHPDDPPWATPLAWATRRGHDAVARLLREAGGG